MKTIAPCISLSTKIGPWCTEDCSRKFMCFTGAEIQISAYEYTLTHNLYETMVDAKFDITDLPCALYTNLLGLRRSACTADQGTVNIKDFSVDKKDITSIHIFGTSYRKI